MKRTRPIVLSLVMFLVFVSAVMADTGRPAVKAGEVRLAAIFGNNMVLQRDAVVPLWGWAAPGARITVRASWTHRAQAATAGADGRFEVALKTPCAGGPHQIGIACGNFHRTLENVLFGEVWIGSGQSNMEMCLTNIGGSYTGVENYEQEIAAARWPDIRLFTVQNRITPLPQEDCSGAWAPCRPETVARFSATAYFFGRALHQRLGVPVGLISADWGGTPAEAWTERSYLEGWKDFADGLEQVRIAAENPGELEARYEKALAEWNTRRDTVDAGAKGVFHDAGFDHTAWPVMDLPQNWEQAGINELEAFDGLLWYRKTVKIPETWAGKPLVLELGPVDDMDRVWFNGTRVGGIEAYYHWQTPRKYEVPGSLVKAGDAVIAIRVHDTAGGGGVHGKPEQMKLSLEDGDGALALAGPWHYRIGAKQSDIGNMPRSQNFTSQSPTVLFNGMIAPLIPFAIKGVVWYQGEGNVYRAYQYRELFPRMIESWRVRWGRGDFPFYFVQIAPYNYRAPLQTAELREAQLLTLTKSPNTGMVVTTDIGNNRDIHPKNKQEVGRRLALWALKETYGMDRVVCSGPLYRDMKKENKALRLFFDHTGKGLVCRGEALTHFEVAGKDRIFKAADARLEGNTVVVESAEVPDPVAARFAWSDTAEPNFFNKEGLPASPFRTDDWPGETWPK